MTCRRSGTPVHCARPAAGRLWPTRGTESETRLVACCPSTSQASATKPCVMRPFIQQLGTHCARRRNPILARVSRTCKHLEVPRFQKGTNRNPKPKCRRQSSAEICLRLMRRASERGREGGRALLTTYSLIASFFLFFPPDAACRISCEEAVPLHFEIFGSLPVPRNNPLPGAQLFGPWFGRGRVGGRVGGPQLRVQG